jgi:transcriptional regulator with XRE-family HTH domain
MPGVNVKSPFRRRRLGKRLRALRERAGLKLEEAARRLDLSRSSLFRLETGETRADVHVVRSMMDTYDIRDDSLIEAVRLARQDSWLTPYGLSDMGYVDVETEACGVSEYACQVLPGLLQTEAYFRALLERNRRKRTPRQLENEVSVRLIRKQRLTSDDEPLELVAIIDESVLRREIGGPGLMHAQLHHLIKMSELPTVTLKVLPLKAGAHSALDGAFILLRFPEPYDQDLLYQAYVTGALHIEDERELREARLVFKLLAKEALSEAESVAFIEQLATLLYGGDPSVHCGW